MRTYLFLLGDGGRSFIIFLRGGEEEGGGPTLLIVFYRSAKYRVWFEGCWISRRPLRRHVGGIVVFPEIIDFRNATRDALLALL